MSSSSASLHSKRLPSETERCQMLPDVDAAHPLKLRERQRFFEEVFQHDVDVYLSSAHLSIRDYKRTPIGSISSMEVNVDMLDQMELIDISEQEGLDVFFSSVGDDGVLTSPLPAMQGSSSQEALGNERFLNVFEGLDRKPRIVSTSSDSSSDSQILNATGADTPLAASDDEETQSSKKEMKLSASPNTKEQHLSSPS